MSNAWYIESPTEEACKMVEKEGVVPPPLDEKATRPTPQQLFTALESFPEYHATIRRGTYKRPRKGAVENAIYVNLRREDGSYAIEITILSVTGDEQPALIVFKYWRQFEQIVQITEKLAETCGPLILWDDGGEPSVAVYPPKPEGSAPPC